MNMKMNGVVWVLLCQWLPLTMGLQAVNGQSLVHHEIRIRVDTASSSIKAWDTLSMAMDSGQDLQLTLRPEARVHSVSIGGLPQPFLFQDGILRIPPRTGQGGGGAVIAIHYDTQFLDDVPTQQIYHENRSYGAAGFITNDKLILMDGAGWYPDLRGSLLTFRLEIDVPEGMEIVTAGTLRERKRDGDREVFVWEMDKPARGISLSGGPYRVKSGRAGDVPTFFYHFPGTETLSSTYLEAVGHYIPLYERLFGPYPFSKFAVVENFLPTGYGFPSYTLLGSDVIRLPFIVNTSLGHEVAHSWWGNGVFVDYEKGNWSEGLTTYVADYLYKEQSSPQEAREYRMRILRNYLHLVSPHEDFPLSRFLGRDSPAARAVGYGKAAMVFHMARRLAGEEAFWNGLARVYHTRLFQEATWNDFATAFSTQSKQDFKTFFTQWVDRPGAPTLRLGEVQLARAGDSWQVTGSLIQEKPLYDLLVPVRIEVEGGDMQKELRIRDSVTPFTFESGSQPKRLLVDPDAEVFRRLHAREVPPDVNSIKGSDALVAIMADGSSDLLKDAARILLAGLGRRDMPVLDENEITASNLHGKDLLLFGIPKSKALIPILTGELTLDRDHFSIDGKDFRAPTDGAFFAMKSRTDGDRSAGVLLAFSRDAAVALARKVPHYGSYSALVIQDGSVTIKRTWPVEDSPLIHRFSGKE